MEFERTGQGPTLLLLPGLGCDCRMWAAVQRQLAAHFDVVCPRVWGRGSLAERARNLAKLLDRLSVESVGIAGLSMGGYLTFECLRQWPSRIGAAALLDTTAWGDDEDRVAKRHQVLRLLREGRYGEVLQAFLPSVLSPRHGPGTEAYEALLNMGRELGPEVFAADVEAILNRGSFEDLLPGLRLPTLFLAGEEDALTPPDVARRMADLVPGAQFAVVPEAGHMTPLENPARVARRLSAFFRDALGS